MLDNKIISKEKDYSQFKSVRSIATWFTSNSLANLKFLCGSLGSSVYLFPSVPLAYLSLF